MTEFKHLSTSDAVTPKLKGYTGLQMTDYSKSWLPVRDYSADVCVCEVTTALIDLAMQIGQSFCTKCDAAICITVNI